MINRNAQPLANEKYTGFVKKVKKYDGKWQVISNLTTITKTKTTHIRAVHKKTNAERNCER